MWAASRRFSTITGAGVRGDLQAVVRAILLDPEARDGDDGPALTPPDTSGHLREPVFAVASILRGLGATVNDTNNLTGQATNLRADAVRAADCIQLFRAGISAFRRNSRGGTALLGPEFQLQISLGCGGALQYGQHVWSTAVWATAR